MNDCSPTPENINPIVKPAVFKIEDFLATFPEFDNNGNRTIIMSSGRRAMMYFSIWKPQLPVTSCIDFGMNISQRDYAMFLLTAHIATLSNNNGEFGNPATTVGRVKKATIAAITVERDSSNSYTADEVTYWLNQTQYGVEYQAFVEMMTPVGVYTNTKRDTIRVLR